MNPAPSLILFTVMSGFGFGLFFWLGLDVYRLSAEKQFLFTGIAFVFTILGLLSSTFHLKKPQRLLLAFTQWRSSWLSREAILALFTMAISFIYAGLALFFDRKLVELGYLSSLLSIATIFSTAMIYAQMKTVPRWNSYWTPIIFLIYGLVGSAIFSLNFFAVSFAFFLTALVQLIVWIQGDKTFSKLGSLDTATGLNNIGTVRLLESPHSGDNYLLKEMVFVVAQKHQHKLRWISLALSAVVPAFISIIASIFLSESNAILLVLAVIHLSGTLTARWLFFAEAEHVVKRYYGK